MVSSASRTSAMMVGKVNTVAGVVVSRDVRTVSGERGVGDIMKDSEWVVMNDWEGEVAGTNECGARTRSDGVDECELFALVRAVGWRLTAVSRLLTAGG